MNGNVYLRLELAAGSGPLREAERCVQGLLVSLLRETGRCVQGHLVSLLRETGRCVQGLLGLQDKFEGAQFFS